MRQGRLVTTAIIWFAALTGLVLAAVLALPWIASTQIVRDRIAYELSAWSGYRVQLGQAPSLEVWPTFSAHLSNVQLYEWGNADAGPVLEAERVDIDLSALAALRGDIVFSRLSLQSPLLRLTRPTPVFDLPPLPGGGRMSRAIEQAARTLPENGGTPDTAALPSDPFGQIGFNDGRVAVTSSEGDQIVLSGLSGQLDWPALNRPATLAANGIWRSEAIEVEASGNDPLLLLAGGSSQVRATLRAAPANATFEGTANFSQDARIEGRAGMDTPSVRRVLEWSGLDIAVGRGLGAAALTGDVSGDAANLRIANATLDVAGSRGTGMLELVTGQKPPSLGGSLAFEQLNMTTLLGGLTPHFARGGDAPFLIDADAARQLNLDLRLSATRVEIASLAFERVAAALQIRDGAAAVDISDSTAFGGTVQGAVRVDTANASNQVELRLLADNVDLGAIVMQSGARRFVPQTRADLSAILKGQGDDWRSVIATLEGTLTASFGAGDIVGINANAFMGRTAEGLFFPLSSVADGAVPIRGLQFSAMVGRGLARVDTADVLLDDYRLALNGVVPLAGRALALSGEMVPIDRNGEQRGRPVRFFVGGGWDEPFVSPMSGID